MSLIEKGPCKVVVVRTSPHRYSHARDITTLICKWCPTLHTNVPEGFSDVLVVLESPDQQRSFGCNEPRPSFFVRKTHSSS
ncbi:hypothetical protein Pcinc_020511 [Petrolisthes cinctipes]|uniref:Uncharacterized protein n=1 Tax=Petrolisthes cinctipes TaxID=88211 RepID=A0AAE1KJV4_PETCI|nr:hypothetical protein Pcinc_020511 [Petrolisthes cinctipes]